MVEKIEKIVRGFGVVAVAACLVMAGYILFGDIHTEAVSTASYTMTVVEKTESNRLFGASRYITVEDTSTHKRQRFNCTFKKTYEEVVLGDKVEIVQKIRKNRYGNKKAYYEIKGNDIYLENEYTAPQE